MHRRSLAAIRVMSPSISVAVPFQHLDEKIVQRSLTFAILQASYHLKAPTRAKRTQSAWHQCRALPFGGRKQAGIKVSQTLYSERTSAQQERQQLHLLQRHGRLLRHQRKKRSLKYILHLHGTLGKRRIPTAPLPLMSGRINLEVRCSP